MFCLIIAYTKTRAIISSVKGSILTKVIGYMESVVLIICTKNASNLTKRYRDMVPDRQKVWMDGRTDRMDGWTHGRRQNYTPLTLLGITTYMVQGCGSEQFPRYEAFYKVKGVGHARARHRGLPGLCN